MVTLRNMKYDDLQQVNLILSKSFTHARVHNGLKSGRVPLCFIDFLAMYLASNPGGAFVIEKKSKLLAYCFTRLWGKVGWLGPLSVIPSQEDRGYGKQIVTAAIDYLKKQGADIIGLETAAHSGRNVAFYTKLNFIPGNLTVDLLYNLPSKKQDKNQPGLQILWFNKLLQEDRGRFLRHAKKLATQLQPGLDYTSEIQLVAKYKYGDACLLLQRNKAMGFLLAHTEPYSPEESRQLLKINALQMSPDLPVSFLDCFLDILEKWAFAERLTGIYLRVPTNYFEGFQFFVSKNFKIVNCDLRMTLNGYLQQDNPQFINFSKWE